MPDPIVMAKAIGSAAIFATILLILGWRRRNSLADGRWAMPIALAGGLALGTYFLIGYRAWSHIDNIEKYVISVGALALLGAIWSRTKLSVWIVAPLVGLATAAMTWWVLGRAIDNRWADGKWVQLGIHAGIGFILFLALEFVAARRTGLELGIWGWLILVGTGFVLLESHVASYLYLCLSLAATFGVIAVLSIWIPRISASRGFMVALVPALVTLLPMGRVLADLKPFVSIELLAAFLAPLISFLPWIRKNIGRRLIAVLLVLIGLLGSAYWFQKEEPPKAVSNEIDYSSMYK